MARIKLQALVVDRIMAVYVASGNECDALDEGWYLARKYVTARDAMAIVGDASAELGLSL